MKAVLIVLAFAAVAFAQNYVPSASATFCGKYTLAVFGAGNNNATNQYALIGAVVDRAVGGCTTAQGCSAAVVGVANSPLNAKYFNGSYPPIVNYSIPANYQALRLKLVNFFSFALGCTFYLATVPLYSPPNLYGVHGTMGLTQAIWNEFITNLVGAIGASGVPLGVTTDPTSEISYLSALVGTMGNVPVSSIAQCTSVASQCQFSICSDRVNCFVATDYHQLISGTDVSSNNVWASYLPTAAAVSDVALNLNGNINWRFGGIHNVLQTPTLGASTGTTGGFTSGAVIGGTSSSSYTHQFTTAGTYYYRCITHSTMLGTITVTGSTAAGLTASVTVLAAAILAAFALKQ